MRIVFIANKINGTTGLERMISVQANYFVRNFGYDVHLVLIEQNKNNPERTFFEVDNEIPFHFINAKKGPKKSYFKLVKSLNKLLPSLEPDIVMVCIDDIAWLYVPYFLKKNYKIVYQRHSTKDINLNRYYKGLKTKINNAIKSKLVLFGGNCYDRFVILTNDHRQDWKFVKRLRVIGNPIILDAGEKRAELTNKVVLAVGRHDPVKGFDMLINSWASVLEHFPDWTLRIVGQRITVIDLRKQAKDLEISKNVEFLEHTKEISKEYLNASILVCSSVIEGFPLTIVEAMSFGVPVVSFDCPYGPRAIIKNGEDGILVPPKNIVALSESIQHLIEDNNLRKDMGKKAQINIQRFAKENIMKLWQDLFEELHPN